jgi:hypothetical protein
MNTYPEIGKTKILDISSPKKCSDQVNRDNIRGLSEEFSKCLDDIPAWIPEVNVGAWYRESYGIYTLNTVTNVDYKFDPREDARLDARNWKYSSSPIGYVTIFMDLPTLAAWNYGSFNGHPEDRFESRCSVTKSDTVSIETHEFSVLSSSVVMNNPSYLSKRVLPASGDSLTNVLGHVDAGWAILEAMHHLGFDTGKFRALVNFKHKDKSKRGLYMTFKLPTIEEPAIERSASEIYNSNDPITKGDIGRIFQDALNNGGV